jgi:hypothetical protein
VLHWARNGIATKPGEQVSAPILVGYALSATGNQATYQAEPYKTKRALFGYRTKADRHFSVSRGDAPLLLQIYCGMRQYQLLFHYFPFCNNWIFSF